MGPTFVHHSTCSFQGRIKRCSVNRGTRLTKSYKYFRQSIVYHLWYHVMLYRPGEVIQN